MFLNSVILVLQEMLEAALLISVMLVFSHLLRKELKLAYPLRASWVAYAIIIGLLGAWIYASYTPQVSEWFDYVGQEVVNSTIQIIICLLLILFSFQALKAGNKRMVLICMTSIVALSIIREASEIILYVSGVAGQPENFTPVLLGGLIGAGIGMSTGILLFYSLIFLKNRWAFRLSLILLALVTGNMASQAIQELTQADLVPFTPIAWDSSLVLPENTISGQLLYALIGYEATPSTLQVAGYLFGMISIILSPLFRTLWPGKELNTVAVVR